MATDEHETQQVVAHHAVGLSHLERLHLNVIADGLHTPRCRRLLDGPSGFPAEGVVGLVPGGDGQPCPRILGNPGAGPRPQCRDRRILNGVLGQLQGPERPVEDRQDPATLDPYRLREPVLSAHAVPALPCIGTTGRTSTRPRHAAGICAAHRIASSRSATSTR